MRRIIAISITSIFTATPAYAANKIIGNNDDIIKKYTENVGIAKKYLKEIQDETKKSESILKNYRKNGLSPEVPAQGQKFVTLKDKGAQTFGDSIFVEPFGRCGALGSYAWNYWQSRYTNAKDQASMKELYQQGVADCKSQIESKPTSTITIEVSPPSNTPPYNGCLQILDLSNDKPKVSTWTCNKTK